MKQNGHRLGFAQLARRAGRELGMPIVLSCLAALFCAAPATADEGDDLARNRALWQAAAVEEGRVVRVRHRPVGYDHEVEAPRGLEYYWTVEGLFDLVATALEREAEVRASYDPTLGYPTEIHVDYDADLIGDEVDLRITRLERLDD
jgi:hypothetical protein